MSKTLLMGKARELYAATLLAAQVLHVYLPVADNGLA